MITLPRTLFLAAALLAFSTPSFAREPIAPAQVEAVNPSAKAASAAFAHWRQTLSKGDAAAIVALYAPDAVLLATLHNQPISNQAARTEYFEGLMKKPKLQVTLDTELVRVLDPQHVAISGTYTFQFEDKEQGIVRVPARYSYVFENQNGAWLIVEHHSSKFPVEG